MKMRWFDRFLQFVSGLVLFAMGALLLLFGANVIYIETFSMESLFAEPWQWTPVFVVASLLLMALGVRLVIVSFGAKKRKYYSVQNSESDRVQISIQAIDHLVRKCLQHYAEIFLTHVQIGGQHDAIVIQLRMAIRSDVRIPELVSEIRHDVKEYIESCSGVKVERVDVMVEETKDSEGQQMETEHLIAQKRTPLLPPTAEIAEVLAPEEAPEEEPMVPDEPAVAEDFSASAVSLRDDSVLNSETLESTFEDERDPAYLFNARQEESSVFDSDELTRTDEADEGYAYEMEGEGAPDETQDELVSLDAFEPEIEDHDVDGEDDEAQ